MVESLELVRGQVQPSTPRHGQAKMTEADRSFTSTRESAGRQGVRGEAGWQGRQGGVMGGEGREE